MPPPSSIPVTTSRHALRVALWTLLLGACAIPLHAQPFETLELSLTGTVNVNRNFLHEFWRAEPGGGLNLTTPFYLGVAEAGGILHRYRAKTGDVPRFDALLIYVGWGFRLKVAPRLAWQNGFRVGNYRMTFDEDTFAGERNESELALAFRSSLRFRLSERVAVRVSGSYMKAFTFHRLKLFHVSAGVSYRMRTPGWLREFLR
ncbi:hypothetical protein [Rhodocaloribacter sp.]